MNVADIAILMIFALSMLIGLVRGLMVEVMSIVVWVLASAAAYLFGPVLAGWLGQQVELSSLRIFLGYGLVFVAVLVVGALLVFLLKKLIEGTGLSGTDRLLGMLFGALRGGALVVILILVVGLTPIPQDVWWQDSRAVAVLQPLAEQARAWLPANVADKIRIAAQGGQQQLELIDSLQR